MAPFSECYIGHVIREDLIALRGIHENCLFSGMDNGGLVRSGIMDLLQELHRGGATILVVTHSAEMTRRAEREVRIVDGRIVQHPLLGMAKGCL